MNNKKRRYEISMKGVDTEIRLDRYPRNYYEACIGRLNLTSTTRMLKIGCGYADDYQYYKQAKLTLVDISEQRKRDYLDRHGSDIEFLTCDVDEGVPLPDASYDVILSMDTIEHVYNRYNFMRECCRLLVPNGRAIIATPNLVNVRNRIRVLFGLYPHTGGNNPELDVYDASHVNTFTFSTLRELGENNGFTVDEEFGYGSLGRLHSVIPSLLSGGVGMVFRKGGNSH